jgi:hypothetical protein
MAGLFDDDPRPPEVSQYGKHYPPAQGHSTTSVAAADAIEPAADTLRGKCLDAIRDAGPDGLTDEEGITRTGMSPSTWRPRRVELVEDGFVRDSRRTRPTASGRAAVVWVSVRRD